jgi:hypothetical protein
MRYTGIQREDEDMNSIFSVLTMVWTLQGGQYFNNAMVMGPEFATNNNYFIQTSFEFQLPLSLVKGDSNNFFIGADTENQFFKCTDFYGFAPVQDTYRFNTGIRFYGIELGFQHMCLHPVIFDQNIKPLKYLSSYDKIYFKVSGSF